MPAKRTRAEKPEAQRGKRAKVTRQPKLSSDAAKGGRRKATSDQGGKGAGVGGSGAAAARGGAGGGDAAVDVSVAAVKAALPGLLKALSALTDTYLVPFPEEVAALSAAARALQPDDPCRAFEAATGLVLTGPFDALEGALPEGDSTAAILHYRYFHDPPCVHTGASSPARNTLTPLVTLTLPEQRDKHRRALRRLEREAPGLLQGRAHADAPGGCRV